MTATMLKRDAVTIIKAALTGTETSRFTDVLEVAFIDDSKLPQPSDDPLIEEDNNNDDELLDKEEEAPKPLCQKLSNVRSQQQRSPHLKRLVFVPLLMLNLVTHL